MSFICSDNLMAIDRSRVSANPRHTSSSIRGFTLSAEGVAGRGRDTFQRAGEGGSSSLSVRLNGSKNDLSIKKWLV